MAIVTLHTPLVAIVTLNTPLVAIVTLHTPLVAIVTLRTPLVAIVTLHTPGVHGYTTYTSGCHSHTTYKKGICMSFGSSNLVQRDCATNLSRQVEYCGYMAGKWNTVGTWQAGGILWVHSFNNGP